LLNIETACKGLRRKVLRVRNANYISYGDEPPTARVLLEEKRPFYAISRRRIISLPFVLVLHVPAEEAKAMEVGDPEAFDSAMEKVAKDTYDWRNFSFWGTAESGRNCWHSTRKT
jgi:hypothetical protein